MSFDSDSNDWAGLAEIRLIDGLLDTRECVLVLDGRTGSNAESDAGGSCANGNGLQRACAETAAGLGESIVRRAGRAPDLVELAFEALRAPADRVGLARELVLELQRGDEACGVAERH
jgi:hypothetical protein